jgi:hypothetical protein
MRRMRERRGRWRWLWYLGVIIVNVVILVLIVAVFRSSGDGTSFRLRVRTMLPEQVSVRPDTVRCPARPSESPIAFDEASLLADVLPLYDGDLIAVRFSIDSRESALPDTVGIESTWPAEVVGEAGPMCAFVVGESAEASLSWDVLESGAARFELGELTRAGPTTVEVWLVADDPSNRATFASFVTPDIVSDAVVVDPLGGRLQVERRRSSTPVIDLEVVASDPASDTHSVVAIVTNPSASTRALDVRFRLEASGPVSWQSQDTNLTSVRCTGGPTLDCDLGDLADDEVIEISATMTPEAALEPGAVSCGGTDAELGFGLCVEATATAGEAGDLEASSSWLIGVDRPSDEPLLIVVEPDPVVAAPDRPVTVMFFVSTGTDGDLGSVRVVGSDCTTVERLEQSRDDGNAFLEPGETWQFSCLLALPESGSFRFDVAAVEESGGEVSATYEDFADIVDPRLTVESTISGTQVRFEVSNTGRGELYDVAIRIPGCTSASLITGAVDVLREGDTVVFACETGDVVAGGVVAYATAGDGGPVASSG